MSWKTINLLLGMAATDAEFFQELRADPIGVIKKYELDLTLHESTVLQHIQASTLVEFSQQILEQLEPSPSDS